MRPPIWMVWLAAMAGFASGCAVSRKHTVPPSQVRPALDATKDELLAQYSQQARAIRSLNATVTLIPTAGSAYSGVIEEYHEVNAFILAQQPSSIRVIGQAPVVAKNVFDMVSDGKTFRIFIPSKHKFIVGPTEMTHPAKKPIENLRPQHLLDALFWPEIPADAPLLFEESNQLSERDYVLTLLRPAAGQAGGWEIERKIWFDRADLNLARIEIYVAGGRLISDIRYADWQPGEGGARFPRHLWIARPHDDYQLEIRISKLAVNQAITADRFQLEQPPGTELVRLDKEGREQPQP
jgi:outer membrane lipoprotein-sorting protein